VNTPSLLDGPVITPDMARELALSQKVCIRPLLRRVHDRQAGTEEVVALPCGSTREAVCSPCAHKARLLRMQQCQEGWHRTDEPEHRPIQQPEDQTDSEDQADDGEEAERRVRSTRRRQDAPDLPRVVQENRTVGRVFATPDGREYRPSMFLTLTMPSYGAVTSTGVPVDPAHYNYRRQALDTLHFARLVDRFWQNLRRAAGYKVQYFGAVGPQRRLVPHLHAAIRGAIPRATIRQVVAATYLQLWWPSFDQPVYVQRAPVWEGEFYVDADTGEGSAHLAGSPRPARRQPWCEVGARDAVRPPGRHGRHHRPVRGRRPGRPLPQEVPDQSRRRYPYQRGRPGAPG
jgi:hypothetical protein